MYIRKKKCLYNARGFTSRSYDLFMTLVMVRESIIVVVRPSLRASAVLNDVFRFMRVVVCFVHSSNM